VNAHHGGDVGTVAIGLAIILIASKIGGDLAVRARQPAVLGELAIGVLLGNLSLLGFARLEPLETNAGIDLIGQLGVLVLLFSVGLESTVGEMKRVGGPAFVVAVLGVVTPWLLGWGVGRLMLPDHSMYVHIFLGAALTATSVGITARVLQDLGRSKSAEAKIILGAAVIDDVLGLVILSLVTGLIAAANAGTSISYVSIGMIVVKASVFLFGSLAIGVWLAPRFFRAALRLRSPAVLLTLGLAFCFLLAYLSEVIGLAPIVGAFAAGLILEPVHYRDFVTRGEHPLEESVVPIANFLVPVFFVVMGMHVEASTFARMETLGLAAILSLAAIAGKQACSLGAGRVGGKKLDRLSIGIGMIPRGEVGLIFASIGAGLTLGGERIVSEAVYSALVIMVIVTTLVTPPALKWSLSRGTDRRAG
jgi:Kef-type K+ transport system membrane component KefB